MAPIKQKDLPAYTWSDYQTWEGKWELIHGIPYSMSPSATKKHQVMLKNLVVAFDQALKNSACHPCEIVTDLDWIIDEHTVVRPDALLSCDDRDDALYQQKTPLVVIEILSPSTRLKDLNLKKDLYAHQNVLYYLVADPENQSYQLMSCSAQKYRSLPDYHILKLPCGTLLLQGL